MSARLEKLQELLGTKFGRLTVTEIIETISPSGRASYGIKCLCECGKTSTPRLRALKSGTTVSCGCLRKEKMRKAFFARRGNKKNEEMTIWDWK